VSTGVPSRGAEHSSRFFETRLSTHRPREDDESAWDRAWWFPGWLERFLEPFLERFTVNRDYEPHLPTLDKWWVEFRNDEKEVWREIGFSAQGEPVLAGPSKRNRGFWNDTNMTLSDFERLDPALVELTSDDFEETWQRFFGSSSDTPLD
jgi:hypothetical protein